MYFRLRVMTEAKKKKFALQHDFLKCAHLQNQVYNYKYVFVVIAKGHLHEIHVPVYKEGPWFWLCCGFDSDPLSSVVS